METMCCNQRCTSILVKLILAIDFNSMEHKIDVIYVQADSLHNVISQLDPLRYNVFIKH